MKERLRHIGSELRGHAPFTALGAITGIIFMLIFKNMGKEYAGVLFRIFHPGHVVLSAMVTASIFSIHREKKNFLFILLIGYIGSIGIATFSDCLVPYFGESLIGLHIRPHSELGVHAEDAEHESPAGFGQDGTERPEHRIHLGFIEDWYIVNPAALLGVLIAYFLPRTKFPHAGHVLISTWASSSHILMNMAGEITLVIMAEIFATLFIAVWLPCCISDIVFPLLFVKSDMNPADTRVYPGHAIDSHRHGHKHSKKYSAGEEEQG